MMYLYVGPKDMRHCNYMLFQSLMIKGRGRDPNDPYQSIIYLSINYEYKGSLQIKSGFVSFRNLVELKGCAI